MSSEFRSRTPWREKLERVQEPKLVPVPERMRKRFGAGTMLIPRPLDVDSLIRQVPEGMLVTLSQLRAALAQAFGADVTCPLTTGIFLRISAETAEEEARHGSESITPYWRVVRDDGALIDKFPGGIESQRERLRDEGHEFETPKQMRVRLAPELLWQLNAAGLRRDGGKQAGTEVLKRPAARNH
jgi:hypothetical protein